MKTERRHELHTNELAQQIDQVSDYVRKNAIQLLLGGGIALVVVLGGYWFIAGQRAKVMDGWATLSDSSLAADPSGAILRYKEVATGSSDSALVLAAWSRIGEVAMGQIVAGDKATASTTDWQKTAEEAYTKVAALAGSADVARAARPKSFSASSPKTRVISRRPGRNIKRSPRPTPTRTRRFRSRQSFASQAWIPGPSRSLSRPLLLPSPLRTRPPRRRRLAHPAIRL